VRITNGGSVAQTLQIGALVVESKELSVWSEGSRRLTLSNGPGNRMYLPPGREAELSFIPPDPDLCFPRRMPVRACWLDFQVFAASSPDGAWGNARCVYPVDPDHEKAAAFTHFSSD
jgi:hypothetical protein